MIDKKLFENDELVGKACIIHDVYLSENKEYNILEDHYFTDITTAKLIIDYNKQYYWINGLEFVIGDRDTEYNRICPCYDMSFWSNEGTVVDLESMTIEVLPKEEVLKRLTERIHKWFNVQHQ